MRKKLALIALAGFATSFACLGAASAMSGGDLVDAIFNSGDGNLPRCDFALADKTASRTMNWNGGNAAGIGIPATVHYRRGSADQLTVTGDSALLSHIVVNDGMVALDCRMNNMRAQQLEINLPGREFQSFSLHGSGNMDLAGLDQPAASVTIHGSGTIKTEGTTGTLNVEIHGSGTMEGTGKADTLAVAIHGSGDVKEGGLAVRAARVEVHGSGKATVAPADSLKVDIHGSGTITLAREPKNFTTDISGSGRIVHANGRVDRMHGHYEDRGGI